MKDEITVRVQIDPSCPAPEVIIRADKRTPLIDEIAAAVQACVRSGDQRVAAYRGGAMSLISQRDIIRVYTESKRLILRAAQGEYEMKGTLQSAEAQLNAEMFLRISRFEIVNINWIESFDMSTAGTIRVVFEDGSVAWVARRYVRAIEQRLTGI